MIGKTNAGGGGGISSRNAVLVVSAPSGATVTATNGVITVTSASWADPILSGTTKHIFTFSPAQFGQWTVTAVDTPDTASDTVSISAAGWYETALVFGVYIIRNGVWQPGFTAARSGGLELETGEGYVRLYTSQANGTFATVYANNNIDFSANTYSTLNCKCQVAGYAGGRDDCPAFGVLNGIGSGSNYSTFIALCTVVGGGSSRTIPLTETGIYSVDVSTVTGTHKIGCQCAGTTTGAGEFRVYDLWLTR